MTKCILIFDELEECLELKKTLEENAIYFSEVIVILPSNDSISDIQKTLMDEAVKINNLNFKFELIENIRILNPKLDRQIRQKNMRNWLMPFGFIAGLTFSNMTNLSTFSFLGLSHFGESIIGGLLGMSSGYLGSIFASSSINLNRKKEIRSILNFNKNRKWLILMENQIGYEMPWILLKESKPKEIIFLAA